MKHKNNKFITYNHTLDEYYKKYRNRRDKLLKYSKSEIAKASNNKDLTKNSLLKHRRWWFINDTYYEIPKPPRITWFRNLRTSTQIVTSVILGGLVITGVAIPTTMIINKIRDSSIQVTNGGDADILFNKVTLVKQGNGDYVGSLVLKDNMSFSFIESKEIIVNNIKLKEVRDYKIDETKSDLTIYSHNNINNKCSVTLYIKKKAPKIILNENEVTIHLSEHTHQLTATVEGVFAKVVWDSNNEHIAKVDADSGLVKGVAVGSTTITAKADNVPESATCEVTVEE